MPSWILILGGIVLALTGASLLAAFAYGRFAAKALGVPSYAFDRKEPPTSLDKRIDALMADHPGESGLAIISSNIDAFAVRALSARRAERLLDLMYYIWKGDLTGRLLLGETVRAAERGVRVRLLLDDVGIHGFDAAFLALGSHPNIELRLFNPTRARQNPLRRGIEMALRAFSVTRRMHNKAWIADGRVAVVGGRNIGDEYFDAAETSSFRDLDLLAFGAVVDQAERMFDAYWNSGLALPIGSLARGGAYPLSELKSSLEAVSGSEEARPYIGRIREQLSISALLGTNRIHWSPQARLVADPPEKASGKKGQNWLMRELMPLLFSARQTLEITSPYFVPGEIGTTELTKLVERGTAVSVLTTSLAATDVAAVHGGYAPYRKRLLAGGVALYELRPTHAPGELSLRGSSNASLHTKAFTVDDRHGFIGSLNFDPRSVSLNTEMGILFDSPALISEMRDLFAEEISPSLSYEA